jgi:hypothetical protein
MKILVGRPKDLKDIKHVFRTSWTSLDKERLLQKAAKVGADRKLAKVAKSVGFKILAFILAKCLLLFSTELSLTALEYFSVLDRHNLKKR